MSDYGPLSVRPKRQMVQQVNPIVKVETADVVTGGAERGLTPESAVRSTGITKAEYLKFHEDFCARMSLITKAKNADYTGHSTDPFANLRMVEHFNAGTTEQSIFIRMLDKMSRISSFIAKGTLEVRDESIQDTLLDCCNYAVLLACYLRSKK